jgi:type IV secretory pathway TraG/TraD family ATPase VirD4
MNHRLSRYLLMTASGSIVGCIALILLAGFPWSFGLLFLWLYQRRGQVKLWAFGTARTATRAEIQDSINAKEGLPIGQLMEPPSIEEKIIGIFDPRLSDQEACGRFFNHREIVRLNNSVHISVCAPTRSGKGVSLLVPFLKSLQ